mmetsp:Transcript_15290/g.45295  ORF Transcript_15290/g.45295 Transcript_15290/m.45295 type:complete len:262 (+) Transcript_15290:839-1624(+)
MMSPRHMFSRLRPMISTTCTLTSLAKATDERASRKSPARSEILFPNALLYMRWATFPASCSSKSSRTSSWITCAVAMSSTISANCICLSRRRCSSTWSREAGSRALAMRSTMQGRHARSLRSKNSLAASCNRGLVEPSLVASRPPTWCSIRSLISRLSCLKSERTEANGFAMDDSNMSGDELAVTLVAPVVGVDAVALSAAKRGTQVDTEGCERHVQLPERWWCRKKAPISNGRQHTSARSTRARDVGTRMTKHSAKPQPG